MDRHLPVSRREVLGALGAGVTGGLAGCNSLAELFPQSGRATDRQATGGPITGRVTDTNGTPVGDARVEALGGGSKRLGNTTTNATGRFSIDPGRPVWLRATANGYIDRVVPATSGTSSHIVLVQDSGTAAVAFGGDVMFGRRFTREGSDHLNPRHHIRPNHREADLDHILRYVEPLLSSADLTSVNLESPLTTTSVRHPGKQYTFTSHPAAGATLAGAGVDYAALGNNHAFDALGEGLAATTRTLDSAGIAHSGAGGSPSDAWAPARREIGDLSIELLSCTTIVGGQYDLHWSADRTRGRPATVETDAGNRTVPAGAGVAEATVESVTERVGAADGRADVVAVQIHGGEQYRPTPTREMRRLTAAAVDAGADLVVNHHPHVTGGIERLDGALVAWSLGNLAFDQTLWATFPSYLLTAYVTADGVQRAVVDPLLLEGFVPKGVVGKPNRTLTWRTAGRSGDSVRVTDSGIAVGDGASAPETTTATLSESGAVYARRSGWIRAVDTGSARFGRDLLPTGTFESVDIDETGYDGPLWRFSRTPPAIGASHGADGGGIRLLRVAGNSANVILSNSRRIPVDGPMTLRLRYRTEAATGLGAEAAWYDSTAESAIQRDSWALSSTADEWSTRTHDIIPPEAATYLNVIVTLSPPNSGRRTAFLDDVRLIEWTDADGGPEYDHLRVESEATVTAAVPAHVDEFDWQRLDSG